MKRLKALLIICLSACNKTPLPDICETSLRLYEGEYEVVTMNWTPEGGKDITVDINDDGKSSNDLALEILSMTEHNPWKHSKLFPDYENKTGTLVLNIPIIDYYCQEEEDIPKLFQISFPEIIIRAGINNEGRLYSDRFESLEWPDEERVGLRSFGGVEIVNSHPGRIDLNIEHYMVYDYKTSQLMIGTMSVWLSKTSLSE